MVFNSWSFIFAFLPVALCGTFLLARRGPVAAQYWLIAASLFFYGAWNVLYLPLLLGSIAFNYTIAARMIRSANQTTRTRLLWCAVAFDLGLLGYYKYTAFFIENLDALSGANYAWRSVILPLGISFYTFQQLTLLVDIGSGNVTEFRWRDFLLFVTFFPHLISGPIVHHREMMPQFQHATYRLNWENLAIGCVLLAFGLFKKVVLADMISDYVSPIYHGAADGQTVSLFYAWAGAIGFTLQMYFDFSGYSDMALGLARMVGIKLPMNFNSPLKAVSVIDYWARWHITLTRFLTAYVYNPIALAQARKRAARGRGGMAGARTSPAAFLGIVAVPMLVTMFLSGLWHGAGNQFLIFGLLHGVALVINHAWRLIRPRVWPNTTQYRRVFRPVGWLLTFLVVVVALTWFHVTSVAAGANMMMGLIGQHGAVLPNALQPSTDLAALLGHIGVRFAETQSNDLPALWVWIAMLLAIALVMPNTLEILRQWQPAVTMPTEATTGRLDLAPALARRLRLSFTPYWALATGALATFGILGLNRVSEFLYWQF